jgi:hypothetical protein
VLPSADFASIQLYGAPTVTAGQFAPSEALAEPVDLHQPVVAKMGNSSNVAWA